jgi:hypothetical protein
VRGNFKLRVFVTKTFKRFQRKEAIGSETLCEAIQRAGRGLIDADLGAGLIKQRVGRPGQGRRGGYRTIIAYRKETRSVFLYGFPKNTQANIGAADRRDLTDYGMMLLDLGEEGIAAMIEAEELMEIECHDEE